MSDTELVLKETGVTEDDCWSELDESLLVQCDHIEDEEAGSATEKHLSASEKGVSTAEPSTVGEGGVMSGVPQVPVKEVPASSSPPADADDVSVIKAVRFSELGEMTPMELFNKGEYLCVTDLTQQLWCEQHLCYTMMGVEPPASTSFQTDLPLPLPTADRPEVKAGKSVHLARELEVHDVVSVSISSPADKWGLHILNLLSSIHVFLAGGKVAREIPIFGDPFGKGDLVFGIIDELRFDPEAYCVTLTELKTRKTKRFPGKAQKQQHMLQVLMYKQLWDNLVTGNFSPDFFLSRVNLTACSSQPLGKELLQHIKAARIFASTLSDLLSLLLNSAQALVCITTLEIEYVQQDTGSVIGQVTVEESSDWLKQIYSHCMEFWHGRRETKGVDIEEAWKCGSCEYSPVCDWRIQKSALLMAKNHAQRSAEMSFKCADR